MDVGPAGYVGDDRNREAFIASVRAHLWRRTQPLLADGKLPLHHVGTCVLVEVGGRGFVITAAHVLDRIRREHCNPVVPVEDAWSHGLALRKFGYIETVSPPNGRSADKHDFAVLLLDPDQTAALRKSRSFVQLAEILGTYEKQSHDWICGEGFPDEYAEHGSRDGVPTVRTPDSFFHTYELPELPRKVFKGVRAAPLPYGFRYKRNADYSVGGSIRAPAAWGLSGGGMWLAARMRTPMRFWNASSVKLVGIITEWHERESCLLATPAVEVARVLHAYIPDLRSTIESAFPGIETLPRALTATEPGSDPGVA